VRVIRGKYKSRRFSPPKNFPSRPTTDYAKESLFNILENQWELEDLEILDLFAGTGNISLEFLSRGARSVLSVDNHFVSYKFMKQTKIKLKDDNWAILKNDVFKFVPKIGKQFDIIFADPPFGLKNILDLPELIFSSNVLNDESLVIIEHGKETDFSNSINFDEVRHYGGVNFSFFTKK
jgi:16S rRNA (guanine(966)-N(2))-methyltransferase RsmD